MITKVIAAMIHSTAISKTNILIKIESKTKSDKELTIALMQLLRKSLCN